MAAPVGIDSHDILSCEKEVGVLCHPYSVNAVGELVLPFVASIIYITRRQRICNKGSHTCVSTKSCGRFI